MIKIHKYLFYTIFDKNINLYLEFINTIKKEYSDIIINLKSYNTVNEIRFNIHKLLSLLSNLIIDDSEIIFLCKSILNYDKNQSVDFYLPTVMLIIEFDKSIIGL